MADVTRLTRKELYNLVWSDSMVKLSQKFGISDRGLAKICQRYKIPCPGLGYWAKLEHGKPVAKVALAKDNDLDKETIIINPQTMNVLMQQGKKRSIYLKNEIPLTTDLNDSSQLHPLIQKAYKGGFQKAFEQGYYRLKKSAINISVGEGTQTRALCILDTVFKAMLSRGHAVKVLSEKRQYSNDVRETVIIEVKGESIHFYMREKTNQIAHVLTKEEKEHEKKYGYSSAHKYDHVPSGKLEFIIDAGIYDKLTWIDGEKIKLEDRIGHIVKGILKQANDCKKTRIYQIERRIQEMKETKRQLEAEQKRREEEQRIQKLERQVENWRKSQNIKDFLNEAVKLVTQKHGGYDQGSDFDRWIKWGYAYADQIHPLTAYK